MNDQILIKIFESNTHFTATKPQPLIPGGNIFIHFINIFNLNNKKKGLIKDTNDISSFLVENVDKSLAIKRLIEVNSIFLSVILFFVVILYMYFD